MKTTTRFFASTITVFAFGFALGQVFDGGTAANAQGSKVFELRTYTAPEGKLPNLLARFSDHTLRIFEKHGMVNVGYWVPQDTPASANTLIYILSQVGPNRVRRPCWSRTTSVSPIPMIAKGWRNSPGPSPSRPMLRRCLPVGSNTRTTVGRASRIAMTPLDNRTAPTTTPS
jgi:hypothetical protein